jgi:uncharacterized alpha-E superfamily protein
MMNLLYVGIAFGVSAVVSGFMLLRNRRPRSLQSGVEEFARELRALSPEPVPPGRHRRR